VHDNLKNLGLDALDVVNLRVGGLGSPEPGSIAEQFTALAQQEVSWSRLTGGRRRLSRAAVVTAGARGAGFIFV
jgi:hypothetical protein